MSITPKSIINLKSKKLDKKTATNTERRSIVGNTIRIISLDLILKSDICIERLIYLEHKKYRAESIEALLNIREILTKIHENNEIPWSSLIHFWKNYAEEGSDFEINISSTDRDIIINGINACTEVASIISNCYGVIYCDKISNFPEDKENLSRLEVAMSQYDSVRNQLIESLKIIYKQLKDIIQANYIRDEVEKDITLQNLFWHELEDSNSSIRKSDLLFNILIDIKRGFDEDHSNKKLKLWLINKKIKPKRAILITKLIHKMNNYNIFH